MAVSSPDLKAFLVATPFFGGLSDASLDLLISMLVERRFDVGATVVAEGEPGRSMYIVHSGELVVSKLGESGRVIRMSGLGPGDFFGEMTLIEMQNRSATVVAESPTVLYELTARNLYMYYKADIYAYVMVLQNINRELCRRLRRADNRIAELADASRESMTQIACVLWIEKKPRSARRPACREPLIPLEAEREPARQTAAIKERRCCVATGLVSSGLPRPSTAQAGDKQVNGLSAHPPWGCKQLNR